MKLLARIRHGIRWRLARLFNRPPRDNFESRTELRLKFALNEISELRRLVRFLVTDSPTYTNYIRQTLSSFDYQWENIPEGIQLLGHPEFDKTSAGLVESYTGVPASWFKGKTVLDAGSGNGRWSYTFSKLGAKVTAIDYSPKGLENVKKVCAQFPEFEAQRVNLLEPLTLKKQFDFVWSFGVLHHTGSTYNALNNLVAAVRPGGTLFLMIYGEAEWDNLSSFEENNHYTELRRATAGMNFNQRKEYLSGLYPKELVNGYFDAISPLVNDFHPFDELVSWLNTAGFENIQRTYPHRNIFLTARRRPESVKVVPDTARLFELS